jgi:hypothetical protein
MMIRVDISRKGKACAKAGPLSPLLFSIATDMLVVLIERAKSIGQIEGVIPHLLDGGLYILQFPDDTVLFMEHDFDKARNPKLILASFEQLSGLKIIFHKSELFCFGDAQDSAADYAELFLLLARLVSY